MHNFAFKTFFIAHTAVKKKLLDSHAFTWTDISTFSFLRELHKNFLFSFGQECLDQASVEQDLSSIPAIFSHWGPNHSLVKDESPTNSSLNKDVGICSWNLLFTQLLDYHIQFLVCVLFQPKDHKRLCCCSVRHKLCTDNGHTVAARNRVESVQALFSKSPAMLGNFLCSEKACKYFCLVSVCPFVPKALPFYFFSPDLQTGCLTNWTFQTD